MRKQLFDYKRTLELLKAIEVELPNFSDRDLKADHWTTSVTYKWNQDSSLTLIRSIKRYEKGFKREIILNLADSTLFTYSFITNPPATEENYSFIEFFSYCKPSKPIRYISRVDFDHEFLKDTIEFREKALNDFKDSIQNDIYDHEIDNARNILMRN